MQRLKLALIAGVLLIVGALAFAPRGLVSYGPPELALPSGCGEASPEHRTAVPYRDFGCVSIVYGGRDVSVDDVFGRVVDGAGGTGGRMTRGVATPCGNGIRYETNAGTSYVLEHERDVWVVTFMAGYTDTMGTCHIPGYE